MSRRIDVRVMLSLSLCVGVLVIAACAREDPEKKGRLVFLRFDGPRQDARGIDLVTANADGSGQKNLTRGDRLDLWGPSWSPDGEKIAVARARPRPDDYEQPSRWELLVVTASDGERESLATFNGFLPGVAWSPDGGEIAVPRADEDSLEIYVLDADASDARAITDLDTDYVNHPTWSPDGTAIAFESDLHGSGQGDEEISVYVVEVATGDVRRLTTIRGAGFPDWSPDGKRILFVTSDGLYTIRPDGTGLTRVLEDEPIGDSGPLWSADGTKIYFGTARWSSAGDIAVIDADGSCLARVPGTHGGFSPDQEPLGEDGASIPDLECVNQ